MRPSGHESCNGRSWPSCAAWKSKGFSRRAALTILVLVTSIVAASAGPAPASKGPKHKDPKYAPSMSLTGQMSASINCDDWTSNWVFGGEYYPTTLKGVGSLEASARTASGTVDWTTYSCYPPFTKSGSCPIAAESPPPGEHVGDEDGIIQKVAGGLRVAVEFTQFLQQVGAECAGQISNVSEPGEPNVLGFIPAADIGKKVITVPMAGSFSACCGKPPTDVDEFTESQINGTLTLVRKGKK